jgi:hypothetical protein
MLPPYAGEALAAVTGTCALDRFVSRREQCHELTVPVTFKRVAPTCPRRWCVV